MLAPLTLNVYLPEKQYELLKVSNNNGYVSAKKLNATNFNINTSNGRVELREINSPKIIAKQTMELWISKMYWHKIFM